MLKIKKVFFLAAVAVFLVACQSQQTITVQIPPDEIEAGFIGGTSGDILADNSSPVVNEDVVSNDGEALTDSVSVAAVATNDNTEVPAVPERVEISIPAQVIWPVTFASQAPLSNWDALHEEACEEASMIMAVKYFQNSLLNKDIMEKEIQDLVAWEEDNGYDVDLNVAQTVEILTGYFGVKARIVNDVSIDRIKYELARGNLIIIPAAGRDLHNPNYTGLGPLYHMLLIRGYNDREFITNDPGTRKGDGYRYDHATIINAIHDWNPGLTKDSMTEDEMRQGQKVFVVVEK